MRSLLSIFICLIACASAFTATANKPQLPNKVTLQLNNPTVSGQPLTLTGQLNSVVGFQKGFVTLILMRQGEKPYPTVVLFSGDGEVGFNQSPEYQLPDLAPGRYIAHAEFSMLIGKTKQRPTGSKLFIEVGGEQVFSSNISFTQIERIKIKNQLNARLKRNQSNEASNLQTEDPQLYRQMQAINRQQASQNNGAALTIKRLGESNSAARTFERTIQISATKLGAADPLKRLKQNAARSEKRHAILESSEDQH
jgi:hypothetical protein